MTRTISSSYTVYLQQSPERVFAAATNWPSQRHWIPFTTASVRDSKTQGVGSEILAYTGVGPFKFLDSMEITEWQSPSICAVRHTGKVIKGSGTFKVEPDRDGSRLEWSEVSELPFGSMGIVFAPFAWVISKFSLIVSLRLFVKNFHKLVD